jgi:transcriptional regulator with XRE-family HTH domain
MDIPFTIAQLRKAGLTQTEIANAIGLRQSSISDMQAGRAGVRNPSAKVVSGLTSLAAAYHTPTEPDPALVNSST